AFEMRTVREVDVLRPVGSRSHQCVQEVEQGKRRTALGLPEARPKLLVLEPRIGQPDPQPYVEHGHQESQRRKRVVAAVGIDGSSRNRDGGAQWDSTIAKCPLMCSLVRAFNGSAGLVVFRAQFRKIVAAESRDRKSTRLNSSHLGIS